MVNGNNNGFPKERILKALTGKKITERDVKKISRQISRREQLTILSDELEVSHRLVQTALTDHRDSILDASFAFLNDWRNNLDENVLDCYPKAWRVLLDGLTYILPRDDLKDLFDNLIPLNECGQI